MNPCRRWLLAAGLVWGAPSGAADTPLRLGLAPFLSPAALLTVFRPLRVHLERTLQHTVQAYTARDFQSLVHAVRHAEYEIALVPAHLAAVAVADWQWSPLARTITDTRVQVLVRSDGPVDAPEGLRGGRVGMLDAMSLTAAVGASWLASKALNGPGGAETVALPSINSALVALARDEVQAVVATATQLAGLPPTPPANHRVLAQLDPIPGPMLIARPGALPATVQRWREALLSFKPDPARPPTAANARHTPLTDSHLQAMAPYAAFLRGQLVAGR